MARSSGHSGARALWRPQGGASPSRDDMAIAARRLPLPLLAASSAIISLASAGCTITSPVTCWADGNGSDPGFRLLGEAQVMGANVTWENCAQLCADKKKKIAGVEYGSQCMHCVPTHSRRAATRSPKGVS